MDIMIHGGIDCWKQLPKCPAIGHWLNKPDISTQRNGMLKKGYELKWRNCLDILLREKNQGVKQFTTCSMPPFV